VVDGGKGVLDAGRLTLTTEHVPVLRNGSPPAAATLNYNPQLGSRWWWTAYNGATTFLRRRRGATDRQDLCEDIPEIVQGHRADAPGAPQAPCAIPRCTSYIQSHNVPDVPHDRRRLFYNKEDMWEIATEMVDKEKKQIEPYYIINETPRTARRRSSS